MIYRCFYKSVSEGEGIEAEQFRKQNNQVNFDYCKKYCSGFDLHGTCNKFTPDLQTKIKEDNFDNFKKRFELDEIKYEN